MAAAAPATAATPGAVSASSQETTVTVYGPAPPPPINVEYASGRFALIPYFAATRSRVYKLCTTEGRWKLKFNG